jgi:hypothetical protein
MNLKDLFDKAEGGTLTYDQFVAAAAAAKAKFVDLSEGGYVDKQKYTDDLSARDTRITALDETIKTRDTDLANLQEQLRTAGTDAEKLTKLGTDFADLQKKYDKDTKAYEKQLRDQAYRYAVNDFANKQKFTSQAAKRDFINTMLGKNFTMEGDTIVGATDFVAAYTKENEDAFVVEQPEGAGADNAPKPHFVSPTEPTGGESGGESNPFTFNFVGVRPHETK